MCALHEPPWGEVVHAQTTGVAAMVNTLMEPASRTSCAPESRPDSQVGGREDTERMPMTEQRDVPMDKCGQTLFRTCWPRCATLSIVSPGVSPATTPSSKTSDVVRAGATENRILRAERMLALAQHPSRRVRIQLAGAGTRCPSRCAHSSPETGLWTVRWQLTMTPRPEAIAEVLRNDPHPDVAHNMGQWSPSNKRRAGSQNSRSCRSSAAPSWVACQLTRSCRSPHLSGALVSYPSKTSRRASAPCRIRRRR